MVRPAKKYRYKENGDSLQFFIESKYVGSLPIKALCFFAQGEQAKSTILEKVQSGVIKDGSD